MFWARASCEISFGNGRVLLNRNEFLIGNVVGIPVNDLQISMEC